MKYIYPAVLSQSKDTVTVSFPDVACITQGKNYSEGFKNARDGLSLQLYGMIADGEKLPLPSRLEDIALGGNEALALIEVDLTGFKPDWELNHEQER